MTDTPLRVGDVLHGFCNGTFGRDSYEDKRVEALGADWVVARELSGVLGNVPMLYWGSPESLCEYRNPVCPFCGSQGKPVQPGSRCQTCAGLLGVSSV